MRVLGILLILLVGGYTFSAETINPVLQEAQEIADFIESEKWEITNFKIVVHDKLSKEKADKLRKKIENPHTKNGLVENYSVIPLNGNEVKVVYELSSNYWDENIAEDVYKKLESDIFQQYMKNGKVYTCFQAKNDDNINSNFISKKIINAFNINIANILEEDEFTVISGNAKKFSQLIPLNDSDINVQFAIREEVDSKKTITIGTPILVIEY